MAVDVGTAMAYLDLDISPFEKGVNSAMSNLKTFMDSSQSATNRIGALGSAFSTVGGTLTKNVTTPIVGVGVAAVKMASDFEKSMSNVKAISQASDAQFRDLKDTALELGASTAFSATEVADAMTEMAKAGWTSEQIIEGMGGVLDAAAASGEGLASVSTIVADAITGFRLEAADSTKVADLLTQAANSGTIGINDLGESFKYIAPVASSLNISIEEATTAIAAMSMAGIKGSQAGTSLRTMLSRMVKPTKMVQEAMDDLDFSAKNADGTFKELPDILSELRVKFANLTDAEKAQYAAQLAGQEGMSGLLSILNLTQEEYDAIADSMNNASGVAKETAEVMQDNLLSAMEQFGGAIETLAIKVGDILIPKIREIIETFTGWIEKLTELDDSQLEMIVTIAGIVAAIGPVILIVGKMISAVSRVMSVISDLANPITIVVVAIAGLIAIFANLYQTNEEFASGVNQLWSDIKDIIVGAIESIKEIGMTLWEGLQPSFDMLMSTFEGIKEQLSGSLLGLFESVKEALADWQPVIEFIGEVLGAVFLTTLSAVIGTINGFLEALSPIIDIITGIVDIIGELGTLIVSVFTGDFETAKQSLSNIWEEIKGIFSNALLAIEEFVGGFIDGFISSMDSLFAVFGVEGVGQILEDFKNNVITFFTDIGQNISDFFTGIWEVITGWINGVVEWFNEQKELMNEGFGYWLGYILTSIVIWIAQCLVKIGEWVTNIKNKAKEAAIGFFNNIKEWMEQLPEKFMTWLTNIINKIISFKDNMKQSGKDLLEGFWDGLKSVWDSIWSWISGIGEKISGFFSGFLSGAKDALSNVSGSHANGLDYVPYNGYIAELHQGERVLTAEENEEYNNGANGSSNGDTYIFYSYEQLDEYEAAKQMKRAKREMEYEFA